MAWYPGKVLDNIRRRLLYGFQEAKVGITPETLTEAQKRLVEKFREGIARALGVPPEAIREEPIQKWIINWTRAWVKPEYWRGVGVAGQEDLEQTAYELGYELGRILKGIRR